jgi:serine/threonine protein kinase
MDGGKLIGTGSRSCVFLPNLPCENNGEINDDMVSKIIYSHGAVTKTEGEKKMNGKIREIKGFQQWAITYNQFCNPQSVNNLEKYDKNGMSECFKEDSDISEQDFDKHSYMMIGEYGGDSLDEYFIQNFENISNKNLNASFLDLMKKMKSLFLGLKKMTTNKIVHNDIKPGNIVIDGENMKFIDFGLSGMVSDKDHFMKRSRGEFESTRLYIFYPLDYLLFYATDNELKQELKYLYNAEYRRHFDDFNIINNMIGYDSIYIYETIIEKLIDDKIPETTMIKGIDVYGLGLLIPLLFIDYSNIPEPYQGNKMIQEFYNLFKEMIHPLSTDRLDIHTAYRDLVKLIQKYDKPIRSNIKSKKKKSKKKKKKSKKKKRKNKKGRVK